MPYVFLCLFFQIQISKFHFIIAGLVVNFILFLIIHLQDNAMN